MTGQRTQQVILSAQSHQDVFDFIFQAKHLHGFVFGTHHLSVACGGNFQINGRAATTGQQHAAGVIHYCGSQGAIHVQHFRYGFIVIHFLQDLHKNKIKTNSLYFPKPIHTLYFVTQEGLAGFIIPKISPTSVSEPN